MPSLWDFTKEVMKLMEGEHNIYFLMPPGHVIGDWRNVATNRALSISQSDTVLFMEQDFFIESGGHLTNAWAQLINYDAVGFKQEERIHPAFLLVKRKFIDMTSKDFSANPPHYDHFGKFTQELEEKKCNIKVLKDGFMHMNGLTHNFNLCMRNEVENIYRKDEFIEYLKNSVKNVSVDAKYLELIKHCFKVLNYEYIH